MEYKEISRFPGYRAGNDGTIQSCWKRVGLGAGKGSTFILSQVWHDLKQRKDRDGYWHVRICCNKKKHYPMVHSLILLAFKGEPVQGQQCRHEDGNKDNNRPGNLFWGTSLQNNGDRIRHNTIPHGEACHKSKLTEDQVRQFIQDIKAGGRVNELKVALGVTKECLHSILRGHTWTRVTGLTRRRASDRKPGETNRYKKLLNGITKGK